MRFTNQLATGLLLIGLAGCTGVAIAPNASGEAGAFVNIPPSVPAPGSVMGLTAAQLPQVVSTGPAIDLDWNRKYQANVAYVNVSGRSIPIYSGPDGQSRIGTLPPNNGGAIDACAVEVEACSIAFGSTRQRGWVLMNAMAPQGSTPEA